MLLEDKHCNLFFFSKCDIGDKARLYKFAYFTAESMYNFCNYFHFFNSIKYYKAL